MSLFIIGTLQWVSYTGVDTSHDVIQEHTAIDGGQDQSAILDSLKNKNSDTTSLEEKFETLNQLAGNGPNTLSLEEQEQLLERLK